MKNIAVFASGSGSNFEAIVRAEKNYKVSLLIVDKIDAFALERAKKLGVESVALLPEQFTNKSEYEEAIIKILEKHNIDFIALAGYMRLLGKTLLDAYEGKVVNIHPSLLPSFKGKDAIQQAIDSNVTEIGVTVHWVDSGMDTGEIIAQEAFSINNKMSAEDIESRVHVVEHKLYPRVLNELLK